MRPHLGQVADVADMVADAVLLDVVELHGTTAQRFHSLEGLEDGAAISSAAADVVDLGDSRAARERMDEPRDIERMDVVAHLLALVAEHGIAAAIDMVLNQVAQKAMELHAAVVRAREAPPSETAR